MKSTNNLKLINLYYISTLLFLLLSLDANADRFYVDSSAISGANSGTSWGDAYTNLQTALELAKSGDEVWVAKGTYKPTGYPKGMQTWFGVTPRDWSFRLSDSIKVYGGFRGDETSINERNYISNKSILSGDIGTPGDSTDNCYHVLISINSGNQSILDGFTITDGNADSIRYTYVDNINVNRFHGGGIYTWYSSISISNVSLINNSAENGGGIYITSSSPTISNTKFKTNKATNRGGGLYIASYTTAIITNDTFNNNTAQSGGGIYNSSPSTFINNLISHNDGGGLYHSSGPTTIRNSTFSYNSYGVHIKSGEPTIFDCQFIDNDGIGLFLISGNSYISNCAISRNKAGGMKLSGGSTVVNCIINDNSNTEDGGGLHLQGHLNDSTTIDNCTIINNRTTKDGGGISNFNLDATIINCSIISNTARGNGGGIHNYYSSPAIANTVFYQNEAYNGGGIYSLGSDAESKVISNTTFCSNLARGSGGGMYNHESKPKIRNSIFWGNMKDSSSSIDGSDIHTYYNKVRDNIHRPEFEFCVLQLPREQYTANHNNDINGNKGNQYAKNPLFVDAVNIIGPDNIHRTSDDGLVLAKNSPAANSGDNSLIIKGGITDIIGSPRIQNDTVNIGAYEYLGKNISLSSFYNLVDNVNLITHYPNPFRSNLFLDLRAYSDYEISVNIFNTQGQLVFEQKKLGAKSIEKLSLSELASGLYYVNVLTKYNTYIFKALKK